MKYFLPDWDDRVDPGYDFATDRPTLARDPYRDDVYAHEFFGEEPCYDGLLVSRSALADRGAKRELIERLGLRRFFRLPVQMEIVGDCGAFGYVDELRPRYETAEVLDYYATVGVDYGISVDHIIVPAHPEQRQYRFDLTIENAIEFLRLHRASGARFTPVGAVQGWDPASYSAAARRLVSEGYDMLAIGGLVRASTKDAALIIGAIVASVGPRVRLHALGIARDAMLPALLGWGMYSCDSASPMRTAWTSATKNYLAAGRDYAAVRIPFARPVPGIGGENVVTRAASAAAQHELEAYEAEAMRAVRAYGEDRGTLDDALAALDAYDAHLERKVDGLTRQRRLDQYRRTLAERPWARCRCRVCATTGIDVAVFRGNNRNRRRGFHNVMTFYRSLLAARRRSPVARRERPGRGSVLPVRRAGEEELPGARG